MQNIFSDNLFYGLAKLFDRLLGIIILYLLTSNLTMEEFGIWSQILVYCGFGSVFLLFGFYHSISIISAEIHKNYKSMMYLGITLIFIIGSLFLFVIVFLFPNFFNTIIFDDSNIRSLILIATFFVISEAFYELVILGFVRSENKIKTVSAIHIVKCTGRLFTIILATNLSEILLSIMVLNIILNFFICFVGYFIVLNKNYIKSKFILSKDDWSKYLSFSIITNFSIFIGYFMLMGNRFIILHFEGIESNALFSAHYSVISILSFLPMVLNYTMLHHISAQNIKTNIKLIKNIIDWSIHSYLIITLPISLLLFIYYVPISNLLIPSIYNISSSFVFGFIGFYIIFGFEQILAYAVIATKNKYLWIIRLIGSVFQIILSIYFINLIGLVALPYIMSLASFIVCLWSFYQLRKFIYFKEILNILGHFLFPIILLILLSYLLIVFKNERDILDAMWGSLLIILSFVLFEYFRSSNKTFQILKSLFKVT